MKKFFSGIKSKIKTINNGEELFYEKNYGRIGVKTDDDLPINKTIKISNTNNNYQMCFSKW